MLAREQKVLESLAGFVAHLVGDGRYKENVEATYRHLVARYGNYTDYVAVRDGIK